MKRLLARLGLVTKAKYNEMVDRVEMFKRRYDEAWADHLARCGCHDAWDQCPCSEVGHKTPLPEGRMIHECANLCCKWCG